MSFSTRHHSAKRGFNNPDNESDDGYDEFTAFEYLIFELKRSPNQAVRNALRVEAFDELERIIDRAERDLREWRKG